VVGKCHKKKHLQDPKGQGFLYDEKVRQKWFVLTLPASNFQKLDIQVESCIFFQKQKEPQRNSQRTDIENV